MIDKVKIRLATVGFLKHPLDLSRFARFKSKVFEVTGTDRFELLPDASGENWEYSDETMEGILPVLRDVDFIIGITEVPLKDNYYSRRLSNNRVVVTLFEIADILASNNIPLENLIFRQIYEYCLTFKKFGCIPDMEIEPTLCHEETRGCLFDMNGIKSDIVFSTEHVSLCEEDRTRMKKSSVPVDFIENVEKEIKAIRRSAFDTIVLFVKKHPILSIVLSFLAAFAINLLSSFIYEILKNILGNKS